MKFLKKLKIFQGKEVIAGDLGLVIKFSLIRINGKVYETFQTVTDIDKIKLRQNISLSDIVTNEKYLSVFPLVEHVFIKKTGKDTIKLNIRGFKSKIPEYSIAVFGNKENGEICNNTSVRIFEKNSNKTEIQIIFFFQKKEVYYNHG
ncbi:MAG: hypothetical protein FWF80_09095 [Defluviitaleaceae bacterium]|nr:hypothetical protein [Defluviitaleaceae bacterium]